MLYTYEAGQPDAPGIVFLHGGGLSSLSWLPVIERLPEFHCLAPDLPEQGRSKDIPYSIDGSAREVAEIIRQKAAGQKVHLVGLSLGGPVVFTLLRMAPELVDHAMVSGCSGQVSRWLAGLGKSLLWIYKLYKPDYLIRETVRQQGIPDQYKDLVWEDLRLSLSPDFMHHYMTDLATWTLPEAIASPLLVMVGQKEMKAAFTFAKGYLKRYPGAAGAVAPNATHAWCLQQPELFADTVRAWVTGQPLPASLAKLIA
jgi:pimeloyl-ACP methyl ester carboxylesterase